MVARQACRCLLAKGVPNRPSLEKLEDLDFRIMFA
jgi:hypothetical protein